MVGALVLLEGESFSLYKYSGLANSNAPAGKKQLNMELKAEFGLFA